MDNLLYQLNSLQQRYGARLVLDLDRLDVQRGETLAMIGPSGSGKSTLLRLLQFSERPSAGQLIFDGQLIESEPPLALRRRVTTVFQRPMLLDRSVRANVAYGLRLRGRRNGREQVDRQLEQLGLSELAAQPARALSGGEVQRVALARALAVEPDVLLLDEPTANLDPYNVGLIENIIRAQHERGVTIVLVTHHIFQARRLAARTALLLNGRLIESAPTSELLDTPRDPRTRAFLSGEMIY
ncbi:MAG TPA: ATP-binding cassette domain-containing protein [Anaerolineae bacterium]|nr:ATP-binding cassette domain-containing protein [Anaerolineae bacterium]